MIIKECDLRQAIREGLSEVKVNHDDMGYFETLILRRVTDYKTQLLELKEAKKDLEMCEAATPGPWEDNGNEIVSIHEPKVGIAGAMRDEDCTFIAKSRTITPKWIRCFIEAVNG